MMRLLVFATLTVWVCAGRVIVFVSDQHWRLLLTYKFSIQPLFECSWIDIAVENDEGTIIVINRRWWIADHEDLSHESVRKRICLKKRRIPKKNKLLFSRRIFSINLNFRTHLIPFFRLTLLTQRVN